MSLTVSQLQERIEVIETTINTIQTALNNVATRRQLNTLVGLVQTQIQSLSDVIGTVDATGALYPPRYTTTERNALTVTTGAVIYNTTLSKLQFYNGTSWETFTSS